VASGLSSRNTKGMMISKKSMRTKMTTATTWAAVPGDQNVQRGEITGARDTDQRADEQREPQPGLAQRPLRPAVLLPQLHVFRLPRLHVFRVHGYSPPAVQAARSEQPADGQQRKPAARSTPALTVP
jgi:hypothetical protein